MATAIWKDIDVALSFNDSVNFVIYDKADNTGNIIYQGKSFKRPGQGFCSAKVNDILIVQAGTGTDQTTSSSSS